MALVLNGKCNCVGCENAANYRITYDCGEDEPIQTLEICQTHYENHDDLPSGKKFYYFKEYAIKVEVIQ